LICETRETIEVSGVLLSFRIHTLGISDRLQVFGFLDQLVYVTITVCKLSHDDVLIDLVESKFPKACIQCSLQLGIPIILNLLGNLGCLVLEGIHSHAIGVEVAK
jgi:hypothetical protein